MIFKNCIDACFDCVQAFDRCCGEGCKTSDECHSVREKLETCAEICNLVGRLTAKGFCFPEVYELCARYCEECAKDCEKVDHEYVKACAVAAKKCAEACRECHKDAVKCEKNIRACC